MTAAITAWEHGPDCTCADANRGRLLFTGMRCAWREDWFEGHDPTDKPPPMLANRYQHDPDGMATWARARRRSLFPWIRRRAHRAIQYAIYHREVALGWRRPSMCEWVIR